MEYTPFKKCPKHAFVKHYIFLSDKAMALQQELAFLLIYMEAIEAMIKSDFSSNAKTIKRAINKFKQELTDGFSANHLILKLNNNENNDIAV